MSLFQFLVIIVIVFFSFLGYDAFKRKKINILHIFVFSLCIGILIIFTLNNNILNAFGKFFGVARGADLLVYVSIIILAFLYINVLNKYTKNKYQLTKLISSLAIEKTYTENRGIIKRYNNISEKDNYILNIRAYNEETKVGEVIDEVILAGFKKILLINDGSSDNTLRILEQKKQQYPACLLLIVSHSINRGGGAANQTGYKFVQKYAEELQVEWFVGFDADGQMKIKDMDKFMITIKKNKINNTSANKKNIGLYLGSRFIEGAVVSNMPLTRRIILKISRIITKILYGTKISDPHNGFRVMNIPTLRKFLLTSDGMHYANEINEQIYFKKINYEEVPVHINYSAYSLAKGQKNINSIKLAIEMLYKKLFFR